MIPDPNIRILVIDDEPQIRRFMRASLIAEGFTYLEAADAETGIRLCASEAPTLVILDLGLPDKDGIEVLTNLREWTTTPVLILTARDDEMQKVKLLESGANDYLTKPFGIRELIARVKVLLRDLVPAQSEASVSKLQFEGIQIDLQEHQVWLGSELVSLSKKEFALLSFLARHAGKLVTQKQLLRECWGETHDHDTHYLRIFISQLRKKLGDDAVEPNFIATEPGVGYRFIAAIATPPEHNGQ